MVQRLSGGARLLGRGAPEVCHGLVRFGWAAVGRFRWLTGFWDRRRILPNLLSKSD
jgi:hypothetical protein